VETIDGLLSTASGWIWGAPMLVLLVGTGVFLTFRLRGVQFHGLMHGLWMAFVVRKEKGAEGDISHFQALMTALAATVGTGNIAGVATAVAAGGPGALFWMWITGLFGMATKYGEAVLAVRYRTKDTRGEMCGGPMYYLRDGLKAPWLGALFALFAAGAAFGIGNMVQTNSVADAVDSTFGVPTWITGLVLAVCTAAVILFGIKGIGRVTGVLVPTMIVLYTLGAAVLLILHFDELPAAFGLIFEHAFSPTAAAGGFTGALVKETIRFGVARGVFSNESGLGSAPIAAAAAQTRSPVSQALVSMTQTFIDTLVVCTMTGLAIIVTGVWSSGEDGAGLTVAAFDKGLPWEIGGVAIGGLVVTVGLILFAYSTILGWCYYGEKSIEYLFGEKSIMPYRLAFVLCAAVGASLKLDIVWNFSDCMNGLMAFPNLIGLLLLSGVIASETNAYFSTRKKGSVG
jgi:alanine or glycine:cation symporter, AGCS family